MALCVFALRQFFTVFRKRFSWKAASLHETPFEHHSALELARYIIFKIYYRLFVSVQNGQAKIASRNPVPFLFFTTGAHRSFTGILKREEKKEDGDKKEEGKRGERKCKVRRKK